MSTYPYCSRDTRTVGATYQVARLQDRRPLASPPERRVYAEHRDGAVWVLPRDPDGARGLAPIGCSSALTGLAVEALRLDAARGLPHLAFVDLHTGVLYNGPDQVEPGALIGEMRDVEMPPEAIRALLTRDDPEATRIALAPSSSDRDQAAPPAVGAVQAGHSMP